MPGCRRTDRLQPSLTGRDSRICRSSECLQHLQSLSVASRGGVMRSEPQAGRVKTECGRLQRGGWMAASDVAGGDASPASPLATGKKKVAGWNLASGDHQQLLAQRGVFCSRSRWCWMATSTRGSSTLRKQDHHHYLRGKTRGDSIGPKFGFWRCVETWKRLDSFCAPFGRHLLSVGQTWREAFCLDSKQ